MAAFRFKWCRCTFFLLLTIVGLLSHDTFGQLPETLSVEGGSIVGVRDDGVVVFKGIPFAAPPVGDLRWKAPQPVLDWDGVRKCDKFPPSPIQNDPRPLMMWTQEFITPASPLSEDCLYLNVWTGAKSSSDRLPVLVWIHGGAFTSGSGACPIYDGVNLAKQGVVYVSINYRLGVFGFMAHPELSAESAHGSSGNYGLMDQIASLQWVRKNISKFGGDPNRVTIAGQSAGSMSVQMLVASPLAKGLFAQAIAQSGTVGSRPSVSRETAEKTGMQLSGKTRLKNLNGLRRLSADSVLILANELPFGSFFPIVDGHVIPQDPRLIFQQKKHNDVTVMAGWVTGDGDLAIRQPQPADKFRASAISQYGDNASEFLRLFPARNDDEATLSQRKLGMLNFAAFGVKQWCNVNARPTYVYEFRYVPTDKPGFPNYGAFHTSEVPFAMSTLHMWDRPWTEVDMAVQKYMTTYWVNFVKSGRPAGKGLPEWKPYTATNSHMMVLDKSPSPVEGMYQEELDFLERFRK
jgi:para-nitrobenzyl esterase